LYLPKTKGGIDFKFGSRTPTFAASVSVTVMEPPYVIEWRNYCTMTTYQLSDEDAFIKPAGVMKKVFSVFELPFYYSMPKAEFKSHAISLFDEIVSGPEQPYKSPFTKNPNDWSRGYTPQPGDTSSTCLAYQEGLLYLFSFWKNALNAMEVIDVEIVAMNDLDQEPQAEICLEKPSRSFAEALELLYMTEALSDLWMKQAGEAPCSAGTRQL
jgi:hypothetical protein